jgi:hypothetical protein
MEDYRISKWTFDTSAGIGLGLGLLALSGGLTSLKDPINNTHHLHYGGLWHWVFPRTLPYKNANPETIIQNYLPSGSGSYIDFPSAGVVYKTNAFKGKELTKADICGAAAYAEVGAGMVAGYGAALMFLNINQILTLANIPAPQFHLTEIAIARSPAVLFMRGANMGPQAGAGLNAMLGILI